MWLRVLLLLMVFSFNFSSSAIAMKAEDPLLTKMAADIAIGEENDSAVADWDFDAWIGRDLRKLWIKSEGHRSLSSTDDIEFANLELSVSYAVAANWDLQLGVRQDFERNAESSDRSWASIGLIGTAPYFIEVDSRLFVGEDSSMQLLVEFKRELMLTQRWVITPELDIRFNQQSNTARLEGSGLSETEFELRIGYERTRKFQPFAGLSWQQQYGATKKLSERAGKDSSEVQLIVGFEAWY